MKSSRKEIARLEALLKNYQESLPQFEGPAKASIEGYITETTQQLEKVTMAFTAKVTRRQARKNKPSELALAVQNEAKLTLVQPTKLIPLTKVYDFPDEGPAVINYSPVPEITAVSEGGALPADMDLDGSLLPATPLNARGRKAAKKTAKSSLGKHMATFNKTGNIPETDPKELF